MAELLTRAVAPGEVIFRAGDPSDCAYVVAAGHVEIHTGHGADARCIAVLGAGQLLGEMGILDNTPRAATAVSYTHLDVYKRQAQGAGGFRS